MKKFDALDWSNVFGPALWILVFMLLLCGCHEHASLRQHIKYEDIPKAEFTIQFKLVDGTWNGPTKIVLPQDGFFSIEAYRGAYSLMYFYYENKSRRQRYPEYMSIRGGIIDWHIVSINPIQSK